MTAPRVAMATEAETIDVLTRVDVLLDRLGEELARIRIAGELNLEQSTRLHLSALLVEGLQGLFRAELVRLTPTTRES